MNDLFGGRPKIIRNIGAYAADPGTGPDGKTCRQCQHYTRAGGGNRSYPKCGLSRIPWTHGAGTDIRASAPACSLFSPEEGDKQP